MIDENGQIKRNEKFTLRSWAYSLSSPETEGDSGVGVGGEDGRKRVDATMSWMLILYCCCC